MSNDRSPRDVCSITIGISGLIALLRSAGWLPPASRWGFVFRRRRRIPAPASTTCPSPRPARARSAWRSRPRCRAPSARPGPGEARSSWPGRRATARPQTSASSSPSAACSRTHSSIISSVTSTPSAATTASRARSLARPSPRPRPDRCGQLLARLPGGAQVVLDGDAAGGQVLKQRADEVGDAVSDQSVGNIGLELFGKRVEHGGPVAHVDLALDRLAEPLVDVRAQLTERVELADRGRELVVELRQHPLLHVLHGDVERGRLPGQMLASS